MEPESLSGGAWTVRDADDEEATPVWNKLQPVLYGNANGGHGAGKRRKKDAPPEGVLHKEFVKKYLHYAKKLVPALTDEARETIAAEYATLRAKVSARGLSLSLSLFEVPHRRFAATCL
jgi:DNA replicative helicase MCM subunit Mcm2 (Cdc46/Mcm family)